jgi:protocatechuate 3,4-dioxygenase beta subunit
MPILELLLAALLEGTVVGPRGTPLANALVLARPSGADRERAEAVRTDAGGRFRLAADGSAVRDLRVEFPGLAPATLRRVRAGGPLRIALRKGLALEGVVREARTGEPVADARVEAREQGGERFWAPSQPKAGLVEGRSDAKGRYRLEGLGQGFYTVTSRSRERGRALRRAVVAGRVDLMLVAGGTLAGVVTGPDRKPVEGAVVRVEPEAVHVPRREQPIAAEVTDAKGWFELAGLEPGVYRLVVIHRDLAPAVVSGLSVAADAEVPTQVALERGAALSGRLVALPDRPLAGRISVHELDGEPAPAIVTDLSNTRIAGDGRFRLARLPRGSHGLMFMADGYATRSIGVNVGSQDVDLGDVALDPGLTIRGLVRDDAGLPVAGARLTAFQWRGIEGLVRGESQGDGSFVLGGLSPGQYRVTASASGYDGGTQDVAAGADDVAFALRPAGGVRGTVVDSAGRTVEAFTVAARPASRPAAPQDFQVVADSAGGFAVEGLAAGIYALLVSAPGAGTTTVAGVEVRSGTTTNVGVVRLPRTTVVHGTVTDATGSPIGGAVVSARAAGAIPFAAPADEVVTDASGAFDLAGVSPGMVEITVRHPDYADGVTGLAVQSGQEAAPLRITLARGGRLEGLVRSAAGASPPMSFVRLEALGLLGVVSPTPDMVSTLRDGSFTFDHVRPGRARVVLMTGRDGRFTRSEAREIQVREGATTTVQFVSP